MQSALVLEDPLHGSATGTRSGGIFVAGGWQVAGKDDTIYWHVPAITKGAAEFDVRGLRPSERQAGMKDKAELFHRCDYAGLTPFIVPVLKVLLSANPDLNARDEQGHTPLQKAEANGHQACVDLLGGAGISVISK
jgi:hypothetical protein